MCHCMTKIKADVERDIALEHNIFTGVHSEWNDSAAIRKKNKQQRVRSKLHPTVSLTATFTRTTTTGKPFKKADVKVVQIKPKFCCQCGGKL